MKEKLYYLTCEPIKCVSEKESASVDVLDKIDLWHQRLGHVNKVQFKEMAQKKN